MPVTCEPAKPSQDFLGLIVGAIGCLPASTPAVYPPTSDATTQIMNVEHTGGAVGRDDHQRGERAQQGTYAAVNTPAVTSRT